jgi:putative PEP-CTERM system histidine kinase
MNFVDFLFLTAGFGPLALAAFALRRAPRSLALWTFAAGMTLLGTESLLAMASAHSPKTESIIRFEQLRLILNSLLPTAWLPFSLSYSRGNHREFIRRWRPALVLTCLLPLFAVIFWSSLLSAEQSIWNLQERPSLGLLWPSKVINLAALVFAVIILMNLERTLRAAVGTLRWRIKFVVLALGLVFGVRFYTGSQALLYSAPDISLAIFNSGALCLACVLMAVSFLRTSLSGTEVYPSLAVLQHSLTVFLAGIYLVTIGILAKVAVLMGGDRAFPIKSFLVLLSLVALGMALVSDRVRFLGKRFISRHFRRPFYDYRSLWRSFTERTATVVEERAYCRELVNLISETVQVLSVTTWLADESRGKLVLVASTSLTDGQSQPSAAEIDLGTLAKVMANQVEPLALDRCTESWVEDLKRCNPSHFQAGGGRTCVPLSGKGQFLGLLIVGDRVNGIPLSVEDFELLKCIADQAANGLLNLQLSNRLIRAREMEAFQSMAAFFVHDLKNTASSLSLMLQNLPAQMENPAFRQDAWRAVSKAVGKINDLIGRLSQLREKLEMNRIEADLTPVLEAALESVGTPPGINLIRAVGPTPRIAMDPEQIQKVATNLLINAREAVGSNGEIRIESFRNNGWVVFSVQDNGCGMGPEFLNRSLFRPFQTTKKNGIGIGMFHCKTIVEAHQGRIEVESEPGKGTTFRVLLPLSGGSA